MNQTKNMRDIKFRAWNNSLQSWERKPEENALECLVESDLILEQYTGLKDRNGKDIYEGDLISGFGRIMMVAWHGYTGSFDLEFVRHETEPSYTLVDPIPFHYIRLLEATGNIHENPELLQQ